MLHSSDCNGSIEDVERMRQKLKQFPYLLNAPQKFNNDELFPALFHAVIKCHKLCVEFLADSGADSSFGDNHILSIYFAYRNLYGEKPSNNSLDILDRLLQQKEARYNLQQKEVPYSIKLSNHPILFAVLLEAHIDEMKIMLKYDTGIDATTKHYSQCDPINGKKLYISPLGKCLFFICIGNEVEYYFNMAKFLLLNNAQLSLGQSDEKNTLSPFLHIIVSYFTTWQPIASRNDVETFLNIVRMYKSFGGAMFETVDNRNVVEYLTSFQSKCPQNDFIAEALPELKHLVHRPLSLQALSRIVIRKCMAHKKYLDNIELLTLPRELISYLRFDDV